MDVYTNVNDNPKTNLLKDVHGMSIDLIKLACGMQQGRNSSTTVQNAPSLINLQNAPTLINLLSLPRLHIRKTRGKKSLVDYS